MKKITRKKVILTAAVLAMLLAAAVIAVLVARNRRRTVWLPKGPESEVTALAEPEYPEIPVSGDLIWSAEEYRDLTDEERTELSSLSFIAELEHKRAISGHSVYDSEALGTFVSDVSSQILAETKGENRLYSPANLYLALAMLAETTSGNTRAEILGLLGSDSIESLRADASTVWEDLYWDDQKHITVLANSVWLNNQLEYRAETVGTLADSYRAAVFSGTPGGEKMDQALQGWINEQTRGMLTEASSGLQLDPVTAVALVSTLYFNDQWENKFDEEKTLPDVFHAPDGDITVDFMHNFSQKEKPYDGIDYFWGDSFSAVSLPLTFPGNKVRLILPDEGIGIDELLADDEFGRFLSASTDEWAEKHKEMRVCLSIPKFDIASNIDIAGDLKELGVREVFQSGKADFSALTEQEDCFLGQALNAIRVRMDEQGVEAASYVFLGAMGSAGPPKDEIEFVLDRPFLFTVSSVDQIPLLIGVVNHPDEVSE